MRPSRGDRDSARPVAGADTTRRRASPFSGRALVISFLVCLGLAASAFAEEPVPPPGPGQMIQQPKNPGFWGKGDRGPGSYRWKLLGIGVALVGITGVVMLRMVRRANAERAARASENLSLPR